LPRPKEKPEPAGVADGFLRDGERLHALRRVGAQEEVAQVAALPETELERSVLDRGGTRIDTPVGIDAEALDAGAAEIDASPGGAVHALPEGLDVVDGHAQPLRCLGGFAQACVERRGGDEGPVELRPAALLVDPEQVPVAGAEVLHEADHVDHLADVLPGDDGRERRRETRLDQVADPGEDALERPLAADRVVRGGARAVEAHLEAEARGILGAQPVEHCAVEQDAVREDCELPLVQAGHSLDEVEGVAPEERLAAREEEA
jgi:hypothetical protein